MKEKSKRHHIYRKHYEKNREIILEKCAEYRKNNPEKVKEWKRNAYYRAKEIIKPLYERVIETEYDIDILRRITKLRELIIRISEIERKMRQFE